MSAEKPNAETLAAVEELRVAMELYFTQALQSIRMMTECIRHPTSLEQWEHLLSQRIAENHAHERYQHKREAVYSRLRPDGLPAMPRRLPPTEGA
jgi:hypothetical protein